MKAINAQKVYYEFIDKYPEYAKKILSYELDKDNSIKFKLKDGKIAWYFPLLNKEED